MAGSQAVRLAVTELLEALSYSFLTSKNPRRRASIFL
jgi:hypothetical protein